VWWQNPEMSRRAVAAPAPLRNYESVSEEMRTICDSTMSKLFRRRKLFADARRQRTVPVLRRIELARATAAFRERSRPTAFSHCRRKAAASGQFPCQDEQIADFLRRQQLADRLLDTASGMWQRPDRVQSAHDAGNSSSADCPAALWWKDAGVQHANGIAVIEILKAYPRTASPAGAAEALENHVYALRRALQHFMASHSSFRWRTVRGWLLTQVATNVADVSSLSAQRGKPAAAWARRLARRAPTRDHYHDDIQT